jgi:hypothetical protein
LRPTRSAKAATRAGPLVALVAAMPRVAHMEEHRFCVDCWPEWSAF